MISGFGTGSGFGGVETETLRDPNAAGDSRRVWTFEFLQGLCILLFPPSLEGLPVSGRLLHELRNQIPSSAHSSVVRRHVEFRTLGSSTNEDEKSLRLKSH